jgi:hypothetical protein
MILTVATIAIASSWPASAAAIAGARRPAFGAAAEADAPQPRTVLASAFPPGKDRTGLCVFAK